MFTANGNGNYHQRDRRFFRGHGFSPPVSTGSYAISNDGTGSLSFNNALGTINLAVTMVSASKVYLVEGDQALNAGGLAEKQDLTAIAAAPSGTFVFREHDHQCDAVRGQRGRLHGRGRASSAMGTKTSIAAEPSVP